VNGSRVTNAEYHDVFGYGQNGDENGAAEDLGWIGQRVIAAAQEIEQPAELPKPIQIARLVADHPQLHEPVIDGLLRRGETGNIIADPKRGKSWLAYGMALAVCVGDKWLGTFPCRLGRVLLIDNELHRETLAHRIPVAAEGLAIRQDEYVDNLEVLCLRGQLLDLYGIARALEAIEPGAYDLVILDALYRSLPIGTSENDNAAMSMLFNTIDKLTARLGCAWVNIHHASKGSQATKAVTDVGAGAGAQSRAADCHLILREHEEKGGVVLESVVRSFKPVEPISLRWAFPVWQRDDGLDPTAIKGRSSKAEERQNEKDRDGCYKLIEALRPKSATARDLRGKTGLSKDRTDRLLELLESKGNVKWKMTKRRGNPCRLYTLIEDQSDVVD
jgi:RecA-family ATPase